jgi:ribonuclease-3
MRGLPALWRAVPASFRRSVPAGCDESRAGLAQGVDVVDARAGATLMDLVGSLPPELLQRALTHSSWVDERTGSYERLEFLGDSVLGLAIASALYSRFPDREEGGLARLKAFVVSRASCVQVAERVGLASLVLEHAPATERKRREAARSPSMLGDVLEALIGAVYLEYGFERARPAIIGVFEEQIQYAVTAHVDHKTALQELLAPRGLQPVYRLVEETGPAHARSFTSEVDVDGAVRGRGAGTTIKMSEQAAAREAFAALGNGEPRG